MKPPEILVEDAFKFEGCAMCLFVVELRILQVIKTQKLVATFWSL